MLLFLGNISKKKHLNFQSIDNLLDTLSHLRSLLKATGMAPSNETLTEGIKCCFCTHTHGSHIPKCIDKNLVTSKTNNAEVDRGDIVPK